MNWSKILTWCRPVLIMWNWSTSFLCRGRISGCTSFSWTASPTPRMCTCLQEAGLLFGCFTAAIPHSHWNRALPVPASDPSGVWSSPYPRGDCWYSPYQRRPVAEEAKDENQTSPIHKQGFQNREADVIRSTSWYLAMPPFTAASITPFRHMLSGLMLPWCCLCWYWLIRVRSSWVLFSTT